MDRYSVIVVGDETSPVRRFDVNKRTLQRALGTVAVAVSMVVVASVDYVQVRRGHDELPALRIEVAEQQAQIDAFDEKLGEVKSKLAQIREFERKVRIIANLPGAAATGGEEISAIGELAEGLTVDDSTGTAGLSASDADAPMHQTDVEVSDPTNRELPFHIPPQANIRTPDGDSDAAMFEATVRDAERLGKIAELQQESIAMLAEELVAKRDHLASTPSIWPAKGWMTSRFGSRVSPFTNRKQFHAGIDIAGERGTDVVAAARGEVVFSGNRGPLGRSVILDHGHGIRTLYGHSDNLFVERGEIVERGQKIASLGSTGRSTGPHVHYVVELKGKAVNPLDYIFD